MIDSESELSDQEHRERERARDDQQAFMRVLRGVVKDAVKEALREAGVPKRSVLEDYYG